MLKKILICEDDQAVQDLLKDIVLKSKNEVYTAQDGKEAITKAKEINPDLIILDIRMPKIDGLEAAKMIRKFNTAVKIVFLTGYASPELSKEAAKYDIFDYIVKTASTKEILGVIQKALKR